MSVERLVSIERLMTDRTLLTPEAEGRTTMFHRLPEVKEWREDKQWQYELLFEWAWPRREHMALNLDVGGRVYSALNAWVSEHKYDILDDDLRLQRHWFPPHLFDSLIRCLPERLDMESWIGEMLYHQHFYDQPQTQRFLIYLSRTIMDQMTVSVSDVFRGVLQRDKIESRLLGHDDFRRATREMLGEVFSQLDFDTDNVLGQAGDQTFRDMISWTRFNRNEPSLSRIRYRLIAANEMVGPIIIDADKHLGRNTSIPPSG
ncbi:hypothetical protein BDV97DRAFT_135735 [Delphinella strobiligena]|nr:hypothetical protein BDV97DRAFT_135735 [Delphinella strobiligena]